MGPKGEVYVVEGVAPGSVPREIARFNSACGGREVLFDKELASTEAKNQFSVGAGLINPTGIAASGACREGGEAGVDLFISNPDPSDSFVKLFGPPPNGNLCPPPPKPPLIEAQFASSVGSDGAVVRAKINPRFWPDTAYYVQFGTAQCLGEEENWKVECVRDQPAPPGLDLTDETASVGLISKGVPLGAGEALTPDTAYRYRFVAESGLSLVVPNGPVYGVGGGKEIEAGVYLTEGQSSGFHTAPLPAAGKEDCAHQEFRGGLAAHLPDCRAYELVSPLEKNNGDIPSPRLTSSSGILDQAAPDGEVLTFAAFNAFAEPQAAPPYNQYIAQRGTEGWSTRAINAPRSSVGLIKDENLLTRFKAFDESLCSGWLLQDTDVALVEGAPVGVPGLYRDRGLHGGCAGPSGYRAAEHGLPAGLRAGSGKDRRSVLPGDPGLLGRRRRLGLPCGGGAQPRRLRYAKRRQGDLPGLPVPRRHPRGPAGAGQRAAGRQGGLHPLLGGDLAELPRAIQHPR